ncbi:3'-5' exonuclease [Winogradskyella sp. DF17]|uniref:3'-5' exonuclease n=1 Tax=Winogradskyella pelagia TaxID=2819984 RepID=A0ABS3T756_9FLAO|nr:3'-5' exonuclease [Winogradskyella sp. DF17]MBO3117565.1 3'-5' exonuclease [Winogradskyella sp. DF17]
MQWFKRKVYSKFWEDYIAHFKYSQDQDLRAIRFVVFDTETTGLSTKNDRILSIGCVGIQNLRIKISDQLESYVTQDLFDSSTVKIHGLLKEGSLNKITEAEALQNFLGYIENAVLVAHHAAFDVGMINAGLKRMGLPKLKNKVLDTGVLFQKTKLDLSKPHFSLDELANRFNIPLHDRHTASGDAFITSLLFLKLVSELNKNNTIQLKDLLRNIKRIGLL